jgi:DNA-binding GntR family transcriptional regulator
MNRSISALRPVEDRTLRAQVAQQILDLVTGGHLQPGEKLTEQGLAAQLRVSRAPLREALRELIDRGILIAQPYKGIQVRNVGRRDLEELYSMRTALEKFAFSIAWGRRTPEAFVDLEERYRALLGAHQLGNRSRSIQCEINFHSWVYDVSGHDLLNSYWRRLSPIVQIYLSLHNGIFGARGYFQDVTTEYFKLAQSDNLDAMMRHVEEHMRKGLEHVLSALSPAYIQAAQ